jgi:hypothetical protein
LNAPRLRDAVAALSLANLSLIGVWNALLNYTPAQSFFLTRAPGRAAYAAAMVNVFLIGAALYAVIALSRWIAQRYAWGAVPVLVLAAAPAVKALLRILAESSLKPDPKMLLAALGVVAVAAALSGPRRSLRWGYSILLLLAPLIPIEAAVSVGRCWRDNSAAYANPPLRPRLDASNLPRIVWVVFDELDFRLAFPERPSGLELPEFDRLRQQALFATQAFSPSQATLQSIPALVTGRLVRSVAPETPALALFDGVPSTGALTVFSSVTAMGGNSSARGWYLPYCRMFAGDLSACSWDAYENLLTVTTGDFFASLRNQQQSLFEYGYLSPFPESLSARHRIAMLGALQAGAGRDAADPGLNLVFLHPPVPHSPHYYDSATRTYTRRNSGAEGYRDSLALADVFLGAIRASMAGPGCGIPAS